MAKLLLRATRSISYAARYRLAFRGHVNKMRTAALVVSIVAGVINVVMFGVWVSLVRIEAGKPQSARGFTIEMLSLQVTLLEIVITLVGTVLAVVGLFGYAEIKNAAIARAKDAAEIEARRVAQEQMNAFLRDMQAIGVVPSASSAVRHEVARPASERITPARGE